MRVLAVLLECVAALHKHRTVSISKAVYLYSLQSWSTYVIIAVTMVWKPRDTKARAPERYPPICQHMARKPVKNDITPKNKAMISKGNRNRDMRK